MRNEPLILLKFLDGILKKTIKNAGENSMKNT